MQSLVHPSGFFCRDPFDVRWEEVQHCRNITEAICDITCVFQEPSNRYLVRVEAQTRTRAGFISSAPETIDYKLHVELAPPVLRVKYTRNILGINISFTYPSWMKDSFQGLRYDLEIWRVGSETKNEYKDKDEPSMDINTTEWPHGQYCLHAQTSFCVDKDKKQSNFSEPLCLWLHGEGTGVKDLELDFPSGLDSTQADPCIGLQTSSSMHPWSVQSH
ncbi:interferon lambda receptor 1-like [Candoia aspera]|uniref:interferon lambda receptor 1-like n=1 Tax=Candoia aspera TaxID=51853 RepID=UPI002FD7EE44